MTQSEELANMPGHLIRRLHQRSNSIFQERMKSSPVEITSVQFAALDTLSRHPDIDQAQLAALIHYDRATIGEVVKRLVQKGFVARQVNKDDRRARSLRLTEAGSTVLAQTAPLVVALQPEILANLSGIEREQFVTLAKKAMATCA